MAGETVSVEHGSVTVTTNTASEAEVRQELETPVPLPPVRDEKGRFITPPTGEAEHRGEDAAIGGESAEKRGEPGRKAAPAENPRHNPIARLNQALAQKVEAERRAAALEQQLAQVRAQPAGQPMRPPAGPHGEPTWEQFRDDPTLPDPYTAFQDAKWEWRMEQRLAHQAHAQQQHQTEQQRLQTLQGRLAEGPTRYADYDQVLTEADTLGLQVSGVMQAAIADSPRAADLVYYLATHPEECTQLTEASLMTPLDAATAVRQSLELLLEHQTPASRAVPAKAGNGSAAKPVVSSAKPPIMPVGSSPVGSDEPPGDQASLAEHARYWNRKERVPGARY